MSSHKTPDELLALKKEYLVPCVFHFYRDPPVIVEGKGVWLCDQRGKKYLDCFSGVTVMSAGHSHPEIVEAIKAQADRLQHTTTIYLTEPMFQLAEELAKITPAGLKRTFFCASGSEANETALLMASLATGRHEFISLTDSLHGRTKWAMSATGLNMWRTDDHPVDGFHFVPHPYCARCPMGKSSPDCSFACIDEIEETIRKVGADKIAALIAEPIQGNGGIIIPPDGYWQQVKALCEAHGILLIFDEIQSGMNRTGKWFAGEHWECTPDIMTMAKALGSGMPIAATIATDRVAEAYNRPGASTFGANPMSCAAALATIAVHRKEALGLLATKSGQQLMLSLSEIVAQSNHLRHVRGKGLMIGVEVVDEQGQPDSVRCDDYLEKLMHAGILMGKSGVHRNTLTLMPPLIIKNEHIAQITESLKSVCGD